MFRLPLVAAGVVLLVGSTALNAQTRRGTMLPAETPSAEFADTQYVDSRGCAFVRAASNGQVAWLPLFDADRQPVCGLQPSAEAGPDQPGRVVIRPAPAVPDTPPAPGSGEGIAQGTVAKPPESEMATGTGTSASAEPAVTMPGADDTSPLIIDAAIAADAAPRHMLRVIERRGTIIEVQPDPHARSLLTVIERRGTLFYPDA